MKLYCLFCGVQIRTNLLKHWNERHPAELMGLVAALDKALKEYNNGRY